MGHCWVCICGRYALCVADSGNGVAMLISIGVEFALLVWYYGIACISSDIVGFGIGITSIFLTSLV